MVWGTISYHGGSNLLRIDDKLNSNRCVREVLQPVVIPFFQADIQKLFDSMPKIENQILNKNTLLFFKNSTLQQKFKFLKFISFHY